DAAAEVTEFLEQIARATNHYEVLKINPGAPPREIKNAYHSLARHYHPDRFHELAGTSLHARLESAFARITQAHEALSNPDTKATYDAKIDALKRVGYSQPVINEPIRSEGSNENSTVDNARIAEQRFQEGISALKLGETNTATAALSAAARLAPNQSKYRAYYGKALAGHPQTKRLAEAELQAAVKLDPANASYRVLLASLYSDLGFWRRAINELERALSLDSKNVEARRMLQSLESKK
ncbi:MAG TPA: DnaJ domain-containing protein, partial [Pyrinomonadaceae bacterium]|nr:DnaJ domain-containing protein [Pyrinomonadaceae bacterium]